MKIERILFPTDFSSCSDHALKEAIFLSEQYGAELHVVHVVLPLEADPSERGTFLPNLEEIQATIDELRGGASARTANFRGLSIVQQSMKGISAAEVILKYARTNDIDIIVMGTHGRRGVRHLVLGSVAEEVVRFSPCPVFSIRETGELAGGPFRQILVPLDYSEHARIALAHAKSIAAEYGATIRALHIIEEPLLTPFSLTGHTSASAGDPELESSAMEEMRKLNRNAPGPNIPVEFHVLRGRAPVDIIGFAKRNSIDLIVVASHGLTGIEHFLLGSVAEKVIRMAPCPVFTVKSFGKRLTSLEEEKLLTSEK